MPDVAFLNGRFTSLSRAKVSVEDRGFQFGDGIYELIRAYSGRLFHHDRHRPGPLIHNPGNGE